MIAKYNLYKKFDLIFSWSADMFACGLLLFGTFVRMSILDGKTWSHDCHNALSSEYEVVAKYLISSVASWVSIIILDGKSCVYILSQSSWKIELPKTFSEAIKFVFFWGLGVNSVLLLIHFCSDVHKTFEYLTDEGLLILYFHIAATLKVASVLTQRKYSRTSVIRTSLIRI